ncbi:MAG: ABC-F family ATP-binding cassette domain-containing protein [Planctomycetota bacterium]
MTWVMRATDLHKSYGSKEILNGAELEVDERDRIAVIGRNGAGKSTLLRVLLGQEEADAGTITTRAGAQIAWLRQDERFEPGESALAFLERVSQQPEWRCGQLAADFHVLGNTLEKPAESLSGGWQTRLRLCAMLLAEPDLLVLDEPTNYLDLRTLMLLERFLDGFRGGWLIVSHDRGFLERTCPQTIEVAGGQVRAFPGRVSAWLTTKVERRASAVATNANLLAKKRDLEDFVARNKARASTATRASSKQKELDKLDDRFVDIEADDPSPNIRIPPCESRRGWALQCDNLAVGYGTRTVAACAHVDLERGERVAVLGDNGQGKTTVLRTLAGQLTPISGSFKWALGLRVGLYAQDVYTAFKPDLVVEDHLFRCAREAPGQNSPRQEVLDLAGALLFRGDDLQKRVGVLSGGERARLCLGGLLLGKYDVLMLDEPTNHLDVETVAALADALRSFNGTVLFTSHDRTFTTTVATKQLEVADGAFSLFPGDYATYCAQLAAEADGDQPAPPKPAAKPTTASIAKPPPDKAKQRKLEQAERRVAELTAERKRIEATLNEAYDPKQGERLAAVLCDLEKAEASWLELAG